MKNIVIIGGGIIGLSSALYLQRSGHKVTVLDKNGFQDNCSYGNMGYVCPSHFIPLASPGIVWQGIKWMFNTKSPFYVQPSLNTSLVDWGIKFYRSATKKNLDSAAVPLRNIAILSQQEYYNWEKIIESDFAFEHKGMIEIFKTKKAAHHAAQTAETAKKLGLDVELIDARGLQTLEPQTIINALGAIFFKCDSHLYPNKLMDVLKKYLQKQGVQLATGKVNGFEKNNGKVVKIFTANNFHEADEIVIAAGSWSKEITALLNIKIALMPGRGYSFTLDNPLNKLNHPAVLTEGRVAITPIEKGNKMRYGGTMEIVNIKTAPRYQRVEGIVNTVNEFFPEFKMEMPSKQQIWYGYRPTSADGLPYIGRVKSFKNVIVATGHSMLGLSLGAGTGKLVSEIINEEKTSIDLKAFDVERFK